MNRKALMICSAAALSLAGPLSAQTGLGLVGGMVSANVTLDPEEPGLTLKYKSGFAAGISMTKSLGSGLQFSPELLYVMKGGKATGSAGGITATITEKLTYVEAPLLLRYMFGLTGAANLSLMAGPTVAVNLSCKSEVTLNPGGQESEDCKEEGDETSGVKKTDVGVMFGAGLHLSRLSFSARYEMGVTNVSNDPSQSAKNKALFLMVGIALGK